MQEEDAEEVAARQRLGRLGTRSSSAQSSKPPAASSAAAATGGMARQSAASTSGRHIAPPKLSPDDSWAAELDNDDSWDSIDQKSTAGACLCLCGVPLVVFASSDVHIWFVSRTGFCYRCGMLNAKNHELLDVTTTSLP